MKKLAIMAALLMTGGICLKATAQEAATEANTSTLKSSEAGVKAGEKKDIDEEITNAKLRASTGAKKNISVSSSFSYSGGALTNPTSTERPQLNDNQASADPTKLSGQIAIKWRATDHDNLSLGLGVDYTPSYRTEDGSEPARMNASTPYLDYARVFRSGSVQNILEATLSKYTAKEDVSDTKLNGEIALSHTMMTSLGDTKFEIGNATSVSQEIYSEYHKGSLYQFSLNPILEYAFTEKASFRTVWRAYTATSLVDSRNTYLISEQTQSMGFGYAITRDVYLYPNMQWKWKSVNADKTTVGLSANINL